MRPCWVRAESPATLDLSPYLPEVFGGDPEIRQYHACNPVAADVASVLQPTVRSKSCRSTSSSARSRVWARCRRKRYRASRRSRTESWPTWAATSSGFRASTPTTRCSASTSRRAPSASRSTPTAAASPRTRSSRSARSSTPRPRRPRPSRPRSSALTLGRMQNAPLIARDAEAARLHAALDRAIAGKGSLVLLSGDAGVGKTALTTAVADTAGVAVLRGAAAQTRTEPHGPLVAALRSYLHAVPGGLDECGPLRSHLALVLPELGQPAADGDRATLFEAFRCALVTIARRGPALIVLDDLHWSDEATLDLLAALAGSLKELPILVIAAYRSDELPRGHALRRLRTELRRAGALDELELEPLDRDGSAAVAERVVGAPLSPALAAVVHDRTQGVPFFVEELSAALVAGGLTRGGDDGRELAEGGALPIPATVRDAVLLRAARLPENARAAADVAAVAGERFDLGAVAEIAGQDGLLELVEAGLVEETGDGRAAFPHALVRDALYEDVAWLRRRALHEQLAAELARRDAPPAELATHWLAARDEEKARAELLRAAQDFCAAHAYRDAARAGHQALELWPDRDDAASVHALEQHAMCA